LICERIDIAPQRGEIDRELLAPGHWIDHAGGRVHDVDVAAERVELVDLEAPQAGIDEPVPGTPKLAYSASFSTRSRLASRGVGDTTSTAMLGGRRFRPVRGGRGVPARKTLMLGMRPRSAPMAPRTLPEGRGAAPWGSTGVAGAAAVAIAAQAARSKQGGLPRDVIASIAGYYPEGHDGGSPDEPVRGRRRELGTGGTQRVGRSGTVAQEHRRAHCADSDLPRAAGTAARASSSQAFAGVSDDSLPWSKYHGTG
jgi:hypothetical protein